MKGDCKKWKQSKSTKQLKTITIFYIKKPVFLLVNNKCTVKDFEDNILLFVKEIIADLKRNW